MKFHNKEVLNDTWTQFVALCLLLMLSVDSLNPIKAVSKFLGLPSYYWGLLAVSIMLGLLIHNAADVIYRCTRVFLNSILSISFKSVDLIGLDNVPTEGPVIFTGNHANQFVDGLVVMMTSPRKVGFMIAEKSWHMPVVGHLARIMGCIPVVRPQDSVAVGVGTVKLARGEAVAPASSSSGGVNSGKPQWLVQGEGTSFAKQMTPGDQIRFKGKSVKDSGSPVKIVQVLNDTQVLLSSPLKKGNGELVVESTAFEILKRVDQSVTFAKVYEHLKRGNCIGIFPEGGSHDRTDLLPLKAGVAIMALGVKDKYNINVPVVPVGLNYFRGHRFRGRVTVEFGTPITVDQELMKKYGQDKRAACNSFLHRVEESMRSVIVTTPSYGVMQEVLTARRLFQRSGVRLSAKETQDLNRRFAEGYKVLRDVPEAQEDLAGLQHKLDTYYKTLQKMGLKDHQVPYIPWWTIHDVLGSALYGLLILLLASIPSFILNAPVGLLARYVANTAQKKALEGSKVKVLARDVILSKKIQFSIVAVPLLWFIYLVAAVAFTSWYWSSIMLLMVSLPVFSFFGVRSVEAGMIELKTVRPLFYRLLPTYKATQDELPRQRAELQKEVRDFVKKYASQLGKLAEPKKLEWSSYMHERSLVLAEKAESVEPPPSACIQEGESCEEVRECKGKTGSHVPTITKFHDISILGKSEKSVADLAGLERSMSCPPGYQELTTPRLH
uniref:Phospholipid/glycerol acyltransferase domain-containing protein n=1 Tax=Peronospora matthiolae TaxID=2874970 RepID=A0AAV1VGP2_9STRA